MRQKILLLLIAFSLPIFLKAQQTKVQDSLSSDGTKSELKEVKLLYSQNTPSTASAQSVNGQTLNKFPVNNILNALPGSLAGLYTIQRSGQPGSDGVALTLRGRNPLIVIDGIVRPLTTIDLNEIESVTVLKDAMATAMLGVRGANGAVLITTKKGNPKEQFISLTAQTGIQKPLNMPKALNAFDYATLRNEAVNNELSVNPIFNSNLLYSTADLQGFKDGSDPYRYPNVDWRNQVLKPQSMFTRYTLSASGGSVNVRYFTTLENLRQGGAFQTSSANKYNTNNDLNSYLIRSNLDIDLTEELTAGVHLLGRIYTQNDPGSTTGTIFNSFLTTPNNAYPVLNSNGSYAGNSLFTNNIQGLATGSGYQQYYTRDILADFFIKRTLNKFVPGLYVKAVASYASNLNEVVNRSKPVIAYQAFYSSAGDVSYGPALTVNSAQQNTNLISSSTIPGQGSSRQTYVELSTGYSHVFNTVHNVDAILLANSDSYITSNNLPYTIQGLSGKVSYSYKQKYTAEFAGAYNGSNYYGTQSHYKMGFFPTAGVGWNISKENFIQNVTWLSNLRLLATYGRTGWDNPGYFLYIPRLVNAGTPYFGTSAGTATSLAEQSLATNTTWEKADKLNLSLQGSLIKNQLDFTAEYYQNKFTDLLIQRGTNTSLLGITYPNENIGRNTYKGWEFQLAWHQQPSKDLSYFVNLNAALQNSKVVYGAEATQPYATLQRTGLPVGQAFGYVADGLYQSQADIANSVKNGVGTISGYIPQPGDIKYKDFNGDGTINQFDQVAIGTKAPLTILGLNLGINYKSFDISALLQGVTNYFVNISGNSYFEFQNNGNGQAYEQHLNRWTPATAATATYPRLSIGNNINNQAFSTYWFRRADYLRLKNAEIGYTLPTRYANTIKLKSLRVFANGVNLLTKTKLGSSLDPEVYNGAYPLQRIINFGITVKL